MRIMSNASTVRLRRSCDWLKIEKQVKRYINEGNDVYSVACGGFEVRFDETGRNEATASEARHPLSSVELSVSAQDRAPSPRDCRRPRLRKTCAKAHIIPPFARYPVGTKYKVLDARTGEPKTGVYFCLRLDSESRDEQIATRLALDEYARVHRIAGNVVYANNVDAFVLNATGGAK